MSTRLEASVETEAQFHDLDPMNIVWHGNYARFFELARVALLDRIDYSYDAMKASGYGWPVVEMKLRYARPVRFRQRIVVKAHLVEWEHRMKINFLITDKESGKKICSGYTIQAAVAVHEEELLWETPAVFRDKLKPYL
ncbi:MAG: 4-hydroxybenzoyl-CoA thioesterase [Gammaproteobacteria bacterium]|nr:MAG: 4-hydroxybenzoyl-CoA thioesterase [Gammaproteobacteria bacterium]